MSYTPIEIRAVQEHFGFQSSAPIEKDWHIVRVLGRMVALDATPFRLVFAGGTALARAHKLVRRMSEDIDFKIVPIAASPVARSKLRHELGALRDKITAALQDAGFALDRENGGQVRSRNENHYTVYHLPYGVAADDDLRPTIQLELTYAPLRTLPVALPISSFIAEAFRQAPEVPSIPCVNVTETAAEKLVALTRRLAMELAGVSRDPDPTLVRHIYDLHLISDQIDHAAVVKLARLISAEDAAAFASQYPAYRGDASGETSKALAALENDAIYEKRYASFMRSMVYGEQPEFRQALDTVKDLATSLFAKTA